MWLIPYKQYLLQSRYTATELRDRFLGALHDSSTGSALPNGHQYRGDVTDEGFRLKRRIRRQNAYLPIVVGAFHPTESGTLVQVAVLVDGWLLAIFTLVFVGLAALAFVHHEMGTGAMVLILFLVVHTFFYVIGYLPERMWAIDDVRYLCDAYLPAAA